MQLILTLAFLSGCESVTPLHVFRVVVTVPNVEAVEVASANGQTIARAPVVNEQALVGVPNGGPYTIRLIPPAAPVLSVQGLPFSFSTCTPPRLDSRVRTVTIDGGTASCLFQPPCIDAVSQLATCDASLGQMCDQLNIELAQCHALQPPPVCEEEQRALTDCHVAEPPEPEACLPLMEILDSCLDGGCGAIRALRDESCTATTCRFENEAVALACREGECDAPTIAVATSSVAETCGDPS